MHRRSRNLFHIAVNQQTYAKEHERDAEKLSHIECHSLLKTDLRFLDELDKEAHSKTSDKEGADKESPIEFT
jgi:hypothetical protein